MHSKVNYTSYFIYRYYECIKIYNFLLDYIAVAENIGMFKWWLL